jgi:hypothetical protein
VGIVVDTGLWLILLVVAITRGWTLLSVPATQCVGVLLGVAWVALTVTHPRGAHSTINSTSRPVATTTGTGTVMSSVTRYVLRTAVSGWFVMNIGSRCSRVCIVLVRDVREVVSR